MRKDQHIKKKGDFRTFVKFYSYFKIPWWMFAIAIVFGIGYTELYLKIAEYTIRFNKGELYNSVIIGYVLLNVLSCVMILGQNQFNHYGTYKISLRARRTLLNKILHLKQKDIDEKSPAALVSGVTIDANTAGGVIETLFTTVVSVYSFIKACYILYQYNHLMSLYLLCLIPLAVLVFWFVGRTQNYSLKKIYASYNTMTAFFSEHLSATKHTKAQAMEEREIRDGYKAIDAKYRADLITAGINTLQTMANSVYTNIGTVLICVFGGRMIRLGTMETTGINNTTTYMGNVDRYMAELLTHYQNIKGTQGSLTQVNEVMSLEGEDPTSGEPFRETGNRDIVFDHVSFGYTEKEVLHDISFTLPYQKTIALVGNNGSGKTTLMKLMQGLYETKSGTVTIAGNKVGSTRLCDIRHRFAYIMQGDCLFSGTIRENITYGCSGPVPEEDLIRAARDAGAYDFIMELPGGFDTVLTEAGMNLSGGQRKRISFARAFLQDPDYFLLDEAGANLDNKTYALIYHSLKERMKEKSVIFIAHEMNEILDADYLIVMDHGNLEAFGTHEELLKNSRIYADYVSRLAKEAEA